MNPNPPVPTRSRDWSPLLGGLHADAMDCLQVNLAALADHAYGAGSHLALGAFLRLPLTPGEHGRLEVSAPLADRLTEAQQALGLAVRDRQDAVPGSELVSWEGAGEPLYVVSDAFTMGWLPTAGRQHMQHSFLLIGGGESCLVADGYHNSTPWGEARPGVWRLPKPQLASAAGSATVLRFTAEGRPALPLERVAAGNAAALADALSSLSDYLAALHDNRSDPAVVEQLVLDSWLLGRSRQLHARWLASVLPDSPAAAAAAGRADAWASFAVQVFVAARRAQQGVALADRLFDSLGELLLGDANFASELAAPLVLQALTTELMALLPGEQLDLTGDPCDVVLRELPNFNSFRLVELIGRVELRLGLQLDPDRLSGDSFKDLASLRDVFLPESQKVMVP